MVTCLFLQCGTDSCEQVDIAVLVFREELSSYKENNLGICISATAVSFGLCMLSRSTAA